jgi:predicted small secreted protein
MMMNSILALVATLGVASSLGAGNTIAGVGQDVKATGQDVTHAAKDVRKKM